MDIKERRKKRKKNYVEGMRERFLEERNRYMKNNGLKKVVDFEHKFGFPTRYSNGITGKTDRGIPSWVFAHMDKVNKMLRKDNPNYYDFNLGYVLYNELEDQKNASLQKKIVELQRQINNLKSLLVKTN